MAGTTVTTLAKKKMVKARAGISSLPKIVGMAFGDGGVDSGGTVKPHSADQNTLHHELLRKNVDGYEVLSDTKIRYRCTLAENELANTYISEVGLYDADGDMVAIHSQSCLVAQDITTGSMRLLLKIMWNVSLSAKVMQTIWWSEARYPLEMPQL